MSIRYCNKCFQYLVPPIPKNHSTHSKDSNSIGIHCFVCRQTIFDGVFNPPHQQHLEQEIKARKATVKKQYSKTNKVLDRGNFIPLGVGSILESENIVKRIARDKIKQ